VKQGLTSWFLIGALLLAWNGDLRAQNLDKVLITHSSESISITPLIYGIEKGIYRRPEGHRRLLDPAARG
jgi:hypothetical protein